MSFPLFWMFDSGENSSYSIDKITSMNQCEKKKNLLNVQIVMSRIKNFHVLQNLQQHWEVLTFVHHVACVNVFSPVPDYSAEP